LKKHPFGTMQFNTLKVSNKKHRNYPKIKNHTMLENTNIKFG